jgi:tetratricopeptide (TPR) repeat protein
MMKSNRPFTSFIGHTGITLSILAGVGMSALALIEPAFSESTLQLAQNPQPRAGQPAREVISYEMHGDELKICRPKANSSKQECQVIGKGYTFGLRMGNDLYSQGNVANAETIFRQLIVRFPKQAEAYYKLGSILSSQEKVDEAITQYRQAIKLNPEHAKAHNDLAVALANQSQLDEAIGIWQQAIKINPEYADALNNFGLALLQQGNKEKQPEAVASLTKAKELFIKQGKIKQANRIEQILQEINQKGNES